MLTIKINRVPVLFTKFFSDTDAQAAVNFVVGVADERVHLLPEVLFVDTPATPHLVTVVREFQMEGFHVELRDHHGVEGAPQTPRDKEIRTAVEQVRSLLGYQAVISTRRENPACSSLVATGQFAGVMAVVADPDADGLMAAMKAVGVVYHPEDGGEQVFDRDAALLDGPRAQQQGLSQLGTLLAKGLGTLPPYNAANPAPAEKAKAELFRQFVLAVQGDPVARVALESKVQDYEAAVAEAERLAATATLVASGVLLVDTVGAGKYDLGTLAARLEAQPGCVVTVVRKDNGPIAAKHGGVQYSLAVVKAAQQEVNLQTFLPEGFVSSPEAGVISNTTFLLHASEQVWTDVVLPALRARFGAAS